MVHLDDSKHLKLGADENRLTTSKAEEEEIRHL